MCAECADDFCYGGCSTYQYDSFQRNNRTNEDEKVKQENSCVEKFRKLPYLMQMIYKYKLKLKLSFSGQSSGQKEEEGAKEEAAAEPEPQGSLAD